MENKQKSIILTLANKETLKQNTLLLLINKNEQFLRAIKSRNTEEWNQNLTQPATHSTTGKTTRPSI